MKSLLHINASPRGSRSRTGEVSQAMLDRLAAACPDLAIERLDLPDRGLPAFGPGAVEGRYALLHGLPVPAEQASAWDELRRVADHFLSFDAWLFAVPMWNFGIPYTLKHYVDCVTHPGMTFRNDAAGQVEGLAAGRCAIVVAGSAMPFGQMAEIDHLDFQLAYLKTWLGFIGVTDVHAIRVSGTFGPEEAVAAAMADAHREGQALIDRVADKLR